MTILKFSDFWSKMHDERFKRVLFNLVLLLSAAESEKYAVKN